MFRCRIVFIFVVFGFKLSFLAHVVVVNIDKEGSESLRLGML